jgi:hypothetical protein
MSLKFITDPWPEYIYEEELEIPTLISQFENRFEQRRGKISQGRTVFNLRYNVKTNQEIDRLWNFYRLCGGAKKSFIFTPPITSMLPYDQTKAWWPFHEGELTRIDDWNGYIYPSYSCRFLNDRLRFEEFSVQIRRQTIQIIQDLPISFTNNYGTLSGTYTWVQCPDNSAAVSFDGSSGQCSMGDATDLDVTTGDFSVAVGVYPNSLSAQIGVLSKKTDATAANRGYHMLISTAGTITFVFSDGTQKTVTSATGAMTSQAWKLIAVTISRSGNGQLYVNGAASGSPTAMGTSADASNTRNFYVGRAEGVAYGNARIRNLIFAKKVWTAAELALIWNTWRGILGI